MLGGRTEALRTIGEIRRLTNSTEVAALKNAFREQEPGSIVSNAMRYVFGEKVKIMAGAECFELVTGINENEARVDRSNGGIRSTYTIAVGRLIEDPRIEATLVTCRVSMDGVHAYDLEMEPSQDVISYIMMKRGSRNINFIKRISPDESRPLLHEESIMDLLGMSDSRVGIIESNEANLSLGVKRKDHRLNPQISLMVRDILDITIYKVGIVTVQ
jgi:hypothetical protein